MLEQGAGGGSDSPESARPSRQSRKSAKKRDAIMRAATEIINARTYALATMTEIAASLDLRDAALYYYFPSKQALVYACHVRSMERFSEYLDAADREGASGADKLQRLLFNMLDDSHRHGPLIYFGDYFHLEPEQRHLIEQRASRLTKRIEGFVEFGIDDGSIIGCESKLVVQLLLGMLIWLAKWTSAVPDLTAERLLDAIEAFCMRGLRSRS